MADSQFVALTKSIEGNAVEGRGVVERLKSGPVIIRSEEWISGGTDPMRAEVNETLQVIEIDDFRALLKWGEGVANG